MSLHRNVPRTQRERSPSNAMCREHRRDDGATGDRDGRCEVGAEIPAVLLVDDVFAEGNERPAPPLHVVVSRNYEHGSGLTHEIAERPPALEFAVPRALRQIARDDDGIRTQIGKGAFQRLDDLNVRHAAEVNVANVSDLNQIWPAPPLHVVVSRNYEHGSGLTHEIAERPPALEFAVPRALRQIARDDDGIRTQIGKGAFQRLDDLNVRHAAEVNVANVSDLN